MNHNMTVENDCDVLRAKNEALLEALREIDRKTDWEIDPNNYDHDNVCAMVGDWSEIGCIALQALFAHDKEGK